jgi:hypothetical protein
VADVYKAVNAKDVVVESRDLVDKVVVVEPR